MSSNLQIYLKSIIWQEEMKKLWHCKVLVWLQVMNFIQSKSKYFSFADDGLYRGEFVMIRGPSGGGKTTMLNLIGTIDSSTSGELHILNKKIDQASTDEFLSELRLKHIGFVF